MESSNTLLNRQLCVVGCPLVAGGNINQQKPLVKFWAFQQFYLSASLSVSSCKKLITVSATGGNPRHKLKQVKTLHVCICDEKEARGHSVHTRTHLVFSPWFPLVLCVRRTRSRPVWPACTCIAAAPPDTPSDRGWGRGRSCRRSLAPDSSRAQEKNNNNSNILNRNT